MQQTSINVQPVKGGSEQHNKREKKLDYVREEFSCLNEYWECDTQSNRLSFCKTNAKAKTGRKMQEKATPIREAVVVIKQETTMQDMKNLAKAFQERFGIETFQIAIHKDEGHHKGKEWKPNLHAHMVFDWTDHYSGKSIKLSRPDMVEMQTIVAEVLGMERGVSSDKKHLTALQWKNKREEEQKILLEAETEQLKVGKARKEAAIEAVKTLSEGLKSLVGISDRDKEIDALRSEINRQKQKIEQVDMLYQRKISEEEQKWKKQIQGIVAQRNEALKEKTDSQKKEEEEVLRTGIFVRLWNKATHALDAIITLATDKQRNFYTGEEINDLSQTLGDASIERRTSLAVEYVRAVFLHLVSSEYRYRWRDVLRETKRVAKYQTPTQREEQRNLSEQQRRGMRR